MNRTLANTAIVVDSTADLSGAEERFQNVRVVPLYVQFDGTAYRDSVDLSAQEFYARLRTAERLPTTSQPTPQDFLTVYEELERLGYERIWSLHLSGKLSGTVRSAELAVAERGDDLVRVIDTETASLSVAQLALAILRRLERGTSDDEVDALVTRFLGSAGVVFTVETLEFLQKGGRVGKAQALVGSLLNVKPILGLEAGVVVPVARVRGRQKALAEFERLLCEATVDAPSLRLAIAHADAPDWIEPLRELAGRARPQAQIELVELLGAVVGTHAGPGAVGFFWADDPD